VALQVCHNQLLRADADVGADRRFKSSVPLAEENFQRSVIARCQIRLAVHIEIGRDDTPAPTSRKDAALSKCTVSVA
jgi:hypothetical protein